MSNHTIDNIFQPLHVTYMYLTVKVCGAANQLYRGTPRSYINSCVA
jgi:hypothetical protein